MGEYADVKFVIVFQLESDDEGFLIIARIIDIGTRESMNKDKRITLNPMWRWDITA